MTFFLAACGGGITNDAGKIDGGGGDDGEGQPNFVVDAAELDFGLVEVNAIEARSLNLTNTGTGMLEVSELTIDLPEFSATAGAGLQVAPGGTNTVGFNYLPLDFASDVGTVTITTNDPDSPTITVTLRGAPLLDTDGDGYNDTNAGGDDCDDDDADVHPGAADEFYDGVDANCDGADEYDQDGDGFQTSVWNDDATAGGGDCQDANAEIHPGATDVFYDGIDSNCDGVNDFDQDNDGFESAAYGRGDDCDDLDAEVNPDNVETWNTLDDDCDGEADNDVPAYAASLTYVGAQPGDKFGYRVLVADLDEDGSDDLVAGAYAYSGNKGGVALYDGSSLAADGSDLEDADNYFSGTGASDALGAELAVLEGTTGTAGPYLAIGAPGANSSMGAVYLLAGADAMSAGDTSNAQVTLNGDSSGYYLGRGLASDLDLNGDGQDELFGYYAASTSATAAPYLFLQYGDVAAGTTMSLASVDARFTTDGGGGSIYTAAMYNSFSSGGDLDGDGYEDIVYCDHLSDYGATNDGAVWALWGKAPQYVSASAQNLETFATVVAHGDNYERLGWLCAIGPDWDGDGDGELWMYNRGTLTMYMVPGGSDVRDSSIDYQSMAAVTYEFGASDPSPIVMRPVGDFTGDGVSEWGVGMEADSDPGNLLIWSSENQTAGLDSTSDAFGDITGEYDTDLAFYNVNYAASLSPRPGDLNGDGAQDLVVGDYGWGNTSTSANKGTVYISFSGLGL